MSSPLLIAAAVVPPLLLLLLAGAFSGHLRTATAARGRSPADQLLDLARMRQNAEYEQLRATLWRQRWRRMGHQYDENDMYRIFEDKGSLSSAPAEHAGVRMSVTMGFPPRR